MSPESAVEADVIDVRGLDGGIEWSAEPDLSVWQVRAIAERLAYSTERISGIHVVEDRRIRVDLLDPSDPSDRSTVETVLRDLAAAVSGERIEEPELLRRTAAGAEFLRRTGGVQILGEAPEPRPGLSPELRETAETALDRVFAALADHLGAVRRTFPATIERRVMDNCDYVSMFPQNAYLVAEVPHDRSAAERVRGGDIGGVATVTDLMLAPAVCFHTYAELAGTALDHPVVLSALGRCFRHEAAWRLAPHRLREFSMRELIYLGDPAFVESTRAELIERTWDLFVGWGLAGRIESATDPFYFSEDAAKGRYQRATQAKYELIVELPTGESFAVASFNNIRSSLTGRFDITAGEAPAWSGCTAFGLARWVHALSVVHGQDIAAWPVSPATAPVA